MILEKKQFKQLLLILITIWLVLFVTKKIDLTRTDIGRHLKNGELICQNIYQTIAGHKNAGILNTNFYSYTHSDFSVINHHWGSGVIFYLLHKYFSFSGLNIFYTSICVITFLMLFKVSDKMYGFYPSFFASVLLLPLMAERSEIRPEVFSCFFGALFYSELRNYVSGNVSIKRMYMLVICQILWVNMHIYFILGPFIAGAFLLEELIISTEKFKKLFPIFVLILSACSISPFGLKGIIYPFTIFGNYGYRIAENQSVTFLENYGLLNPNYLIMKISLVIFILVIFLAAVRNIRLISVSNLIISSVFAGMAWFAVRNLSIFGFFALPAISGNIKAALPKEVLASRKFKTGCVAISILVFMVFFRLHLKGQRFSFNNFGIGQIQGESAASDFFKKEKMQGPVFNNYDIGSYLIYYFCPGEKVFVDNRPEAYPKIFFEKEYVPMQENNVLFIEKEKQYKFNSIFFSLHDLTPWGQHFLIQKINDDSWAPVYVDSLVIIFLKKNELNKEIIKNHEIPKSRFFVSKR